MINHLLHGRYICSIHVCICYMHRIQLLEEKSYLSTWYRSIILNVILCSFSTIHPACHHQEMKLKNIESSSLPTLMDRSDTLESSASPSTFSRQWTLDTAYGTAEPSPFSRQVTTDSCFVVQVDVSWRQRTLIFVLCLVGFVSR